jgi:anti-sigma regulatory factor (Ser/Thr protein kinase)
VASAAEARRFVRHALADCGLSDCEEVATLAVSELVTNAVLHARSVFELVLQASGDEVRIEVHDASPILPVRKNYGIDAGTGRGMLLVEALTERWGAEPTGSGKVVWFEIRSRGAEEERMAFELDAETLADLESLQAPPARSRPAPVADPADRSTCSSSSARSRELVGAPR